MNSKERARRYDLASKIVRLVDEVRHEEGLKQKSYTVVGRFGNAPPRNWNDTVVNALPAGGFLLLFWSDVYRRHPSERVTIGHSDLVDRFVEENRVLITEWELLEQVGE